MAGDAKRFLELILTAKNNMAAGLQSAQRDLKRFKDGAEDLAKVGSKLQLLGTVGVGALAGIAVASINAADRLRDLSIATGLSVEDLGRLQYAAQQSGTSTESLAVGVRFLTKNLADARKDGASPAALAFNQLGVAISGVDGKARPLKDVLLDVAQRFTTLEDQTQAVDYALTLFGRSGTELIQFLKNGREGLQQLGDEAERAGVVLGSDAVEAAATFNDQLDATKAKLGAVGNQVASALLPALVPLVQQLGDLATGMANWAKANPQVIEDLGKMALATAAIGTLLNILGQLPAAYATAKAAAAGFWAVATGPAGLAVLAGAGVVGAGAALVSHYNQQSAGMANIQKFGTGKPQVVVPGQSQQAPDLPPGAVAWQMMPDGSMRPVTQDELQALTGGAPLTMGGAGAAYQGPAVPPMGPPRFPTIPSTAGPNLTMEQAQQMFQEDIARQAALNIQGAAGGGQGPGFTMQPGGPVQGTFSAGFLVQMQEDLAAIGPVGAAAGQQVAMAFTDAGAVMGGAFLDALVQGENSLRALGQAFKNWAAQAIASIGAVLLRFLFLKAVLALIPGAGQVLSFAGKIFDPTGVAGGQTAVPTRGATGGLVVGGSLGRDSVPALLAPGEIVLPTPVASAFSRLTQGGGAPFGALAGLAGGGGGIVNVTIQAPMLMGSRTEALRLGRMVRDVLQEATTGVRY